MTSLVRLITVIMAVGLVASCGSDRQESRLELFSRIGANWRTSLSDTEQQSNAAQLRAAVPALLEQVPAPMILMTQRTINGAGIFVLNTEIGNYRVFSSSDDMTVTLEGGVLAETRRLGDDLMSSENGPLPSLLATRSEGDYQRVLRTLDGEGHEISVMYDCRLSQTAPDRMIENCTTPGRAFKNVYEYIPRTPLLARSEQWLSNDHGHLSIEYLRH